MNLELVKRLTNRAYGSYTFYDEDNDEHRKLEAFLLQAMILEGILIKVITLHLKENGFTHLATKEKIRGYNLNRAIHDLRLLNVITADDFNKLEKYKGTRNKLVHKILDQNYEDLDKVSRESYETGESVLAEMISLYKKKLKP